MMKQVLSCINYCHKANIVHRDLKPENILLEKGAGFDSIKIVDFGTSLIQTPGVNLDEKLGTPYYIAPEVLNKCYNEKCDIWAIGVITYINMCGLPPFNGTSDQGIMKRVRDGTFSFDGVEWRKVSESCKDFIRKLLTYNRDERPSAAQAL